MLEPPWIFIQIHRQFDSQIIVIREGHITAVARDVTVPPGARVIDLSGYTVLLAGFTTVRDLGSYRALVDVALRDAINRGDLVGPRMLVAGAYVTITGGAGSVSGFTPLPASGWT
jgi:imidazolonepropionase-like amidohydrolase